MEKARTEDDPKFSTPDVNPKGAETTKEALKPPPSAQGSRSSMEAESTKEAARPPLGFQSPSREAETTKEPPRPAHGFQSSSKGTETMKGSAKAPKVQAEESTGSCSKEAETSSKGAADPQQQRLDHGRGSNATFTERSLSSYVSHDGLHEGDTQTFE